MTIPEFLAQLKAAEGPWCTFGGMLIRRDASAGWQCPISALVDLPSEKWSTAARQLGLSTRLAMRIIRAADGSKCHSAPLRAQLLAATVHR